MHIGATRTSFFPSPSSSPKKCICTASPMRRISSQLNNSSACLVHHLISTRLIPAKVANKPFRPANGCSLTSAPQIARSQPRLRDRHLPATSPASRKLIAISTNTTLSAYPKPGNPAPNVTSSRSCNIKTDANRVSLVSRQGVHATWALPLSSSAALGLQLHAILGEAWNGGTQFRFSRPRETR